jgi:hypothetical protein
LVGEHVGLAGDGGECLEELGVAFFLEVACFLGVCLEVFLDEGSSLGTDSSAWVYLAVLDEGFAVGSLHAVGEESPGFSDDGCGLVVLLHLLFELRGFFGALCVEVVHFLAVVLQLFGLLVDDGGHDFSARVELTFKLGFHVDALTVALCQVLVECCDISIAGILEVSVHLVVFLLFGYVPVLQVVQGAKESVEWLVSFQLQPDRVE